ncbi:MAG: hypothetical protein ABI972_26000, partial [Acidobacteriota bacterium]
MRLSLLGAALLLSCGSAAAGSFTITNLGDPAYDTEASALNASGVAALTSFLPGVNAIANGINNQGWVAGTTFSQSGAQAMLFYDGQSWAVANFAADSYAKDVNDAGQVVGTSAGKAFIAQGGQATFLTHPLDSIYDTANAVNEAGAVAGTMIDEWGIARAYVWYHGQTIWTGFLGGQHSYGTNLNDAGQSTGYSQTSEGWMRAYLSQEGLTIDLGTLGGSCSYAYGINNAGHVVGYSFRDDGTMGAFLSIDGIMLDLSSLVEGAGGWYLNAAYGINDAGQI